MDWPHVGDAPHQSFWPKLLIASQSFMIVPDIILVLSGSLWLSMCQDPTVFHKGRLLSAIDAGHFNVGISCHLMCRNHSTSFWVCLRRNFSMYSCVFGTSMGEGKFRNFQFAIFVQSLIFLIIVSNCVLSPSSLRGV